MSLTLNEIAYSILESIRPIIVDDDDIDLREIKYEIHNQRALWLRNELNKNRTIDDNVVQDLGCIELELVSPSVCPEIDLCNRILRTTVDIPVAIELHNTTAITRVASIDQTQSPFSFVPYSQAIWSGNGRFNKDRFFAFLLNNRMYVIGNKDNPKINMLTNLNIRGVFEDPTEASKFTQVNGQPCYSDDDKYPVNRWMVNYIKGEVVKQFAAQIQLPADAGNDATGKLGSNGK